MNRLAEVLADTADGVFPAVDGQIEVVPASADLTLEAVVEFTGHALVVTDHSEEAVLAQGFDAFGGIVSPDFLRWLAGPDGEIGCLDAVLVRRGEGRSELTARTDLDDHPRVVAAHRRRNDVTVYGDERGLITVGRGLAGRWEVSVELLAAVAGEGTGRMLISEAVGHVPRGNRYSLRWHPGMPPRCGRSWPVNSLLSAPKS